MQDCKFWPKRQLQKKRPTLTLPLRWSLNGGGKGSQLVTVVFR